MSGMRDRLRDDRERKIREKESGVTIVFVSMVLMLLMGMAGFTIDFGWLHWNGIKIQHAADAAALSGVVFQPDDQVTSFSEARAAASENGFRHLDPETTVTPVDFQTDPTAVDHPNQLAVTVTHDLPTFFMRLFGVNTVTIARRAVAEYALPLAMGSREWRFGNDPATGHNPNFWADIHGYYTCRSIGDRFASQCSKVGNERGSERNCPENPERRETLSAGSNNGKADFTGGYLYGVEVAAGASGLSVEIFDGAFHRGGGRRILTGDQTQWGSSTGPTTIFMLYSPDPTPLDTTDGNVLLCKVVYEPRDPFADFNGSGRVNRFDDLDDDDDLDWDDVEIGLLGGVASLWDRLCYVPNPVPGIYPLRVVVADPGGSDDRGLNRFSMRASTSGGDQPRLYGLSDMAIFVNFYEASATFDLAEVPQVHAGKEFVIELWDPDGGNEGVSIRMPDGTGPPCTWTATDGRSGSDNNCSITYTRSFDNHHMQIRIRIPNDYTCTTDCWWDIEMFYRDRANDTTTWSARIEGNPVRLVE